MSVPDPREDRLPKWAQRELARLRRDLDHAHARLTVGADESDSFADPYSKAPRPLGRDTTVQFGLDERGHYLFDARYDSATGRLKVMTGGAAMAVRPQSSNAVNVEAVGR